MTDIANKAMDEANKILESAEEKIKGWTPKVILGGKDGDTTDGADWLGSMKLNTIFLIQDKTSSSEGLSVWQLVNRSTNGLGSFLVPADQERSRPSWVSNARFCQKFLKFDILHVGDDIPLSMKEVTDTNPTEETKEENANG